MTAAHLEEAARPWAETWDAPDPARNCGAVELHVGPGLVCCIRWGSVTPDDLDDWLRAKLAAAAPPMVRTLLRLEVAAPSKVGRGADHGGCSACTGSGLAGVYGHSTDCDLDAALTEAGLPDQASRDAARAYLAGCARIRGGVQVVDGGPSPTYAREVLKIGDPVHLGADGVAYPPGPGRPANARVEHVESRAHFEVDRSSDLREGVRGTLTVQPVAVVLVEEECTCRPTYDRAGRFVGHHPAPSCPVHPPKVPSERP